jgi:hypothetical protein
MEASQWFAEHGFDLIQAICVVGSLLFAAYTFHKDEKSRRIANLLAIQQEYCDVWQALYDQPELARVLEKHVDLDKHPVTVQERLFVKMLILHLDNVRRIMNIGMMVNLPGLQKDVRDFFALPIPQEVWKQMKPYQDDAFVALIEAAVGVSNSKPKRVFKLIPMRI